MMQGSRDRSTAGGRGGKAAHNSVWPGGSREECAKVTDSRLQGPVVSL